LDWADVDSYKRPSKIIKAVDCTLESLAQASNISTKLKDYF